MKSEQKQFIEIMEKFRNLPMKNLLNPEIKRGEWHLLSAISYMSKEGGCKMGHCVVNGVNAHMANNSQAGTESLARDSASKEAEQIKGVKVSELVKFRGVPAPAISRSLGQLEDKEMVERYIDKDDRRNTLVRLTDKGKAAVKATELAFEQCFDKVFDRFGETESQLLIEQLNRFFDITKEEVENATEKGEVK